MNSSSIGHQSRDTVATTSAAQTTALTFVRYQPNCNQGVEALLLAVLDGHHALYKVRTRLEVRGMVPLLQPGRTRASLHDDRLGQILDALFAAHLNGVFGATALHALEVYALSTPWPHQDTTTIPCMEPMRRSLTRAQDLARLVRPMGTAKMGVMLSSQSC